MPRTIAFLRAINVGGHTVKMEALRAHCEALGLEGVETFIASGNVIFTTRARALPALERKLEAHLEGALGYAVDCFLRREAELEALLAHRAFPAEQLAGAVAHNVGFLKAPLSAAQQRALKDLASEFDRFAAHGREVTWLCARKQSESKFSNAVFEKTLGLRATWRGRNSLERLAAKLAAAR